MSSPSCGEMCSTGNNNVTASDWLVKPRKHVVLFRANVKDIEYEEKARYIQTQLTFGFSTYCSVSRSYSEPSGLKNELN